MSEEPRESAVPGREIEPHYARWYAYQRHVPGVEVHEEPGLVWVRQPVPGFGNGGVGIRLEPSRFAPRLAEISQIFRGIGHGFWIGAAAPEGTEAVARAVGYRLRKRFPGFTRSLADLSETPAIDCVAITPIEDYTVFGPKAPHPAIGPITTDIRRFQLRRRIALRDAGDGRWIELGAWRDGALVGATSAFADAETRMGSLHDVVVHETARGRGIGHALVTAACAWLRDRGVPRACLISSAMGESVYRAAGFEETERIGTWYRGRNS